nr:adhesin [Mycoplasmoides genitalium]
MEYHQLDKVVKESLEVEATSNFDPTKRLQKESPKKDSSKQAEKLTETTSSMSSGGATSTRARPSRLRWKGGVKVIHF